MKLRSIFAPLLNLFTSSSPSHVRAIRKRMRHTGVYVAVNGDTYYRLIRHDGREAKTYQRSLSSFCKKYHIIHVYRVTYVTPFTLKLEVKFAD